MSETTTPTPDQTATPSSTRVSDIVSAVTLAVNIVHALKGTCIVGKFQWANISALSAVAPEVWAEFELLGKLKGDLESLQEGEVAQVVSALAAKFEGQVDPALWTPERLKTVADLSDKMVSVIEDSVSLAESFSKK